MTSNNSPDPAKAGKLAQQIVTILKNEDSVTRHRAIQAAMMLFGETTPQNPDGHADSGLGGRGDSHSDLAAFFNREEKLKPSDCAYLCAAYHYAMYGTLSFSLDDLRAIAADAGVVLPDRVDKTLKQAGKNGKKFFQTAGRDAYKPTAAAGVFFKEKWGVKPGRKAKELAKNAQN